MPGISPVNISPMLRKGGQSWSSYCTELLTYIDGLSTPLSTAQKDNLNTLILALKSGLSIDNLSDAFDVLYILAGETAESSLRNLVKNAHHATNHGATFTALEGFAGDAIGKYIDTTYIPNTHSVVHTQNSASCGIYVRSMHSAGAKYLFGTVKTAFGERTWLLPNRGSGNRYWDINSASAAQSSDQSANGFYTLSRTASNVVKGYVNATNPFSLSTVSVGLSDYPIFLLCNNNASSGATGFSEAQIACFYVGKGFTQEQHNTIAAIFETYMDTNGKGVVP